MRRLEKVFLGIGFIFLLSEVFGGTLRYYLASLGIASLVYLPKALLALSLAGAVLISFANKRISLCFLFVVALIAVFSLVGCVFVRNLLQVAFGLWVILPFLYGVFVLPFILRLWIRLRPFLILLWSSAVIGVIINALYNWPWMGFTYSLGEMEIEGSRAWWAAGFGFLRLPGFSRASFDAATQALLLGLMLTFMLRTRWQRLLIWIISGVTIVLTTSKTPFMIWIFLSLEFILVKIIPARFFMLLPPLFALIGIGLPLGSVVMNYDLKIDNALELFLGASLMERLEWLWPMSLRMVIEHGWLLGRGIGGIGSPQQYFEPLLYSPADNLAVYLFGIGGVLGLLFLAVYGLAGALIPMRTLQDRLFFSLTLAVLLEGWMVNVMESSFFAVVFGLTLRYIWIYLIDRLFTQRKAQALTS